VTQHDALTKGLMALQEQRLVVHLPEDGEWWCVLHTRHLDRCSKACSVRKRLEAIARGVSTC